MTPNRTPIKTIEQIVRENAAMWARIARDIHLDPSEIVPNFIVTANGQAFRPL